MLFLSRARERERKRVDIAIHIYSHFTTRLLLEFENNWNHFQLNDRGLSIYIYYQKSKRITTNNTHK